MSKQTDDYFAARGSRHVFASFIDFTTAFIYKTSNVSQLWFPSEKS